MVTYIASRNMMILFTHCDHAILSHQYLTGNTRVLNCA